MRYIIDESTLLSSRASIVHLFYYVKKQAQFQGNLNAFLIYDDWG